MPSSPTHSRLAPDQEATDDRRADGTPDPRRSAGADAAVARLQGVGDPVDQAAHPAARADRHGDPAGRRRHRHRSDRPAHPRPRHRPVVQRCDRAPAARRADEGTGDRGRTGARRQHVRRSAVGHERGAGPRRGLRCHWPHATAGAGAVSACCAAGLAPGPHSQRRCPAHHGGAAVGCRGQGAPAAAALFRLAATRRSVEPGHQRRRQHPDSRCR